MRWAVVAVLLASGCRATLPVADSGLAAELFPKDSVRLARPAVGLCLDGDGILVLEASGTRILRLGEALAPAETIPLATRLIGPQGICSDRHYFYIYDSNTLYRMARDKLVLSAWMGNVRVVGMASYAPAEVLVADANRGAIWYKGFFGDSRQFVSPGTVRRPGAMVTLGDAGYCVVSDRRELVLLNRLGMVVRSRPAPEGTDLLAADSSGHVWLGRTGVAEVNRLDVRVAGNRSQQSYRLAGASSPTQIAAGSRLAVLDAADRVLVYDLP
ncbi:MAG: hypothetical protein ABIK37_03485 [candidate division WOR-3 bacterium]